MIETALDNKGIYTIYHCRAKVITELGEHETLDLTAISIDNAKELAIIGIKELTWTQWSYLYEYRIYRMVCKWKRR